LLLKPKQESHGLLQRLFGGFNRLVEKATNGYVSTSGALIRKLAISLGLLAAVAGALQISGVGTSGGFSFMLEDRVGNDVPYLAENTTRFLDAARKRPELTRLNSSLNATVPQVLVDVNRDKVLKQGVEVDVYSTPRAFMGSLFVNCFNRFGRACHFASHACRLMENFAPSPGHPSAHIRPPYLSTMRWQMASPRPVPGNSSLCRRLKSPNIFRAY